MAGSGAEQDPDEDIRGDDGGQGEGNADLEEVAVGDRMAFLAQDADAGDVGGSTDGSTVAAQGSTGQQTQIQAVESMPISAAIPAMTGIMVAT